VDRSQRARGNDPRGLFARREWRDYRLEREIRDGASRAIGVKRARAEFARLLRDARAGRDWLITDYGRPIAKLVSVIAGDLPLERRVRQLEEAGLIEPARPDTRLPLPIVLRGRRPARTGGRVDDPAAAGPDVVYYWDGPAIFSSLFRDRNTDVALALLRSPAIHLASTLARQQVFALMGHERRRGRLSGRSEMAAAWALEAAPFRTTYACPSRRGSGPPSHGETLGAIELWHLATAQALARPLPELRIVTFDPRLSAAAASRRLPVVAKRVAGGPM
jgi:antitoxin (DNA-binding transcriptional repressor) of toxin-antitoxin stability system